MHNKERLVYCSMLPTMTKKPTWGKSLEHAQSLPKMSAKFFRFTEGGTEGKAQKRKEGRINAFRFLKARS